LLTYYIAIILKHSGPHLPRCSCFHDENPSKLFLKHTFNSKTARFVARVSPVRRNAEFLGKTPTSAGGKPGQLSIAPLRGEIGRHGRPEFPVSIYGEFDSKEKGSSSI